MTVLTVGGGAVDPGLVKDLVRAGIETAAATEVSGKMSEHSAQAAADIVAEAAANLGAHELLLLTAHCTQIRSLFYYNLS